MLEEKSTRDEKTSLGNTITVVIPTLNEESAIARVIDELNSMKLTNILVVDGYSKDRTVEIAKEKGAAVAYQQGKGKTGALKTAFDMVGTPYMLIIDGDFTYDASSVSRLTQHMSKYDEIIGARIPTESASMTRLHRYGNKVITRVFNLLMSTHLTDICSGMYLLRTDACKDLHLSTSGFDVEVEIAAQIASSTGKITEVPINYRPRLGKQKLSTWKHGIRIVKSIIDLGRSYNPGVFYSMLSSLIIIPACLLIGYSGLELAVSGRFTAPWFFVGISMFLVAIQSMGIGVIALMLRRSELRSSRRLAALAITSQA